jgi:hypothetical protein
MLAHCGYGKHTIHFAAVPKQKKLVDIALGQRFVFCTTRGGAAILPLRRLAPLKPEGTVPTRPC